MPSPVIPLETLVDISNQLNGPLSRLLRSWLQSKSEEKDELAGVLSENFINFLQREQALGAARNCRVLFEDFQTHVANLVAEAKIKQENENAIQTTRSS